MSGRLLLLALVVTLLLAACEPGSEPADPLPPDQYLDNALSWLEAHSVNTDQVDWERVRQEAQAMAAGAQETADTYPAIEYALAQLDDPLAFMLRPGEVEEPVRLGFMAVYPENVIIRVFKNGPAEAAGIQVGDRLEALNGEPPQADSYWQWLVKHPEDLTADQEVQLTLRRGEQLRPVTLTPAVGEVENRAASHRLTVGDSAVGYLDLPNDSGSELYPTWAQEALRAVDGPDVCGWIIDLRRNVSGDLWSYLAALSPFLNEGELGGFAYTDGAREMWTLRDDKIWWAEEERFESYVRGPVYRLEQPAAPVAFLISPLTQAAPELVVVAFESRGNYRVFGEPSRGVPNLLLNTSFSDGALTVISGARGMDVHDRVYTGPIMPDEMVETDWQRIDRAGDPTADAPTAAALTWLAEQSACGS